MREREGRRERERKREIEREREKERKRETEKERDRQTETERQTERDTETEGEREEGGRERERKKGEREGEKREKRERGRKEREDREGTERERKREREKEREREGDLSKGTCGINTESVNWLASVPLTGAISGCCHDQHQSSLHQPSSTTVMIIKYSKQMKSVHVYIQSLTTKTQRHTHATTRFRHMVHRHARC